MNIDNIGAIYMIPNLLGDSAPLEVLPISVKKNIESLTYFICENEKVARAFIKKIVPNKSQQNLKIVLLNKFTDPLEVESFLAPCFEGESIGLISDAGCPAIADPGAIIVAMAHKKGIVVKPLVGPSSILLALMGSGMNGQNFAFNGYLPIDKQERKKAIKGLEKKSFELQQTQIFMETPYRNDAIMSDLIKILHPSTRLCIACDLSLKSETIRTYTAEKWKSRTFSIQKRPAIFLIQKD
ncbi:MAG: SAM-dependent methyltransferase [Flavobacteriaceae bacterium]|nr:SAM-dependent methyltransferase [Flavobacteriaceae bacterium]MDG2315021.1 SAM-dependent methyltransferase [Flavobacteriaceae bacterium]